MRHPVVILSFCANPDELEPGQWDGIRWNFRVCGGVLGSCDFESLEQAERFCRDMDYAVVPLNSAAGKELLKEITE